MSANKVADRPLKGVARKTHASPETDTVDRQIHTYEHRRNLPGDVDPLRIVF